MTTLKAGQLQLLRRKLRDQATAALADIRTRSDERSAEPYAALAGSVSDEADEAAADLLVDVDHALIGIELRELQEVAAARERMRRHEYGVCPDCDEPIPFERLCACPTAQRCARCQGLREKVYASAPHASL